MCTALSLNMGEHYFGRTLDLDGSYGEKLCLLPRNAPLSFVREEGVARHPAILGMAVTVGGVPLYYDGFNEAGLCMAGLHFPGNACYHREMPGKGNVSPFELIPWVLGNFESAAAARKALETVNLVDIPYREDIPLAPLHWIVSDGEESVVVESVAEGLRVYENPLGVLTNNPPFPYQMFALNNLRRLSPEAQENTFGGSLSVYSQGLGGLGLPGDVSSMSRFQRMCFYALHSRQGAADPVEQFFHLLGSVEMAEGVCRTEDGTWDRTVYTGCMHPAAGRYYYTTYENRRIRCVDMGKENLEGETPLTFPLVREPEIFCQNERAPLKTPSLF